MAARAVGGADLKAVGSQVKDKHFREKKAADAAQAVFQGPDKRALAEALVSSRLPKVFVTDTDATQTEFKRDKQQMVARESDAPAGVTEPLQLERKDSAQLQLPPINTSERAPVYTTDVLIDLRDSQSSALPELPLDVPPRKDRRSLSLGQCVLCPSLKGAYEPLPPLPALPSRRIKSRRGSAIGPSSKALETPRSTGLEGERGSVDSSLVVVGFGKRHSSGSLSKGSSGSSVSRDSDHV